MRLASEHRICAANVAGAVPRLAAMAANAPNSWISEWFLAALRVVSMHPGTEGTVQFFITGLCHESRFYAVPHRFLLPNAFDLARSCSVFSFLSNGQDGVQDLYSTPVFRDGFGASNRERTPSSGKYTSAIATCGGRWPQSARVTGLGVRTRHRAQHFTTYLE